MTDTEKLDLILAGMQGMRIEMQDMRIEIQDMRIEIQDMRTEMQDMKAEIQDMKAEIQELKRRITSLELHVENITDNNIRLLAENFIDLTNKLNQAIPAANKNLAYEVKVSYLIVEVDKMRKEVEALRDRMAQSRVERI